MQRFAFTWQVALGWAFTVVLIGAALIVVPFGDVVTALSRADKGLLALALIPVSVNLGLRGPRWALLLGPKSGVSGSRAFGPVMAGMALNAVLPGRLGDFMRISIGARRFGASAGFVAGTVFVERLLDSAVMLLLLAASMSLLEGASNMSVDVMGYSLDSQTLVDAGRRIALSVSALLVAALGMLARPVRKRLLMLIARLPKYGQRLRSWVEPHVEGLVQGLTVVSRPRLLGGAVGLSVIIWLALAISNIVVAMAVEGIELGPLEALTVTTIAVGASFLPGAPGAWGLYEAGALLGLALVGALPDDAGVAVAFALLSHLTTYLPTILVGAVASLAGSSDRRTTT